MKVRGRALVTTAKGVLFLRYHATFGALRRAPRRAPRTAPVPGLPTRGRPPAAWPGRPSARPPRISLETAIPPDTRVRYRLTAEPRPPSRSVRQDLRPEGSVGTNLATP